MAGDDEDRDDGQWMLTWRLLFVIVTLACGVAAATVWQGHVSRQYAQNR
jgi:hypothetical protein